MSGSSDRSKTNLSSGQIDPLDLAEPSQARRRSNDALSEGTNQMLIGFGVDLSWAGCLWKC